MRKEQIQHGCLDTVETGLKTEANTDDQTVWEQAVVDASRTYASLLLGTTVSELHGLIDNIMRFKQNLVDLVISTGSADICRTCGGKCCRHGKYHVSVLDMFAYLKTATELIIPDFSTNPSCPYCDASGCTMAARYRPMTCVIFNCEQIEDLLTSTEREILREYEQELRDAIIRASDITGMRLNRALLLSCA